MENTEPIDWSATALHEQRVADLDEAGWTINPTLVGDTYRTWRRLMHEQGRNPTAVHLERWHQLRRTHAESRWAAGE